MTTGPRLFLDDRRWKKIGADEKPLAAAGRLRRAALCRSHLVTGDDDGGPLRVLSGGQRVGAEAGAGVEWIGLRGPMMYLHYFHADLGSRNLNCLFRRSTATGKQAYKEQDRDERC